MKYIEKIYKEKLWDIVLSLINKSIDVDLFERLSMEIVDIINNEKLVKTNESQV